MNKELLQKMINERLVSVQKHPEANLFIYNYTPKAQYEKLWNEVTLQCRGLILDSEMSVISKPFGKFFNLEEHPPGGIPNLPFDVFEKLDGSLGILYWVGDKPYIATRGSFTSEQAKHATDILYKKYSHTFRLLDKNSTYLFEIIYPENRIVIDYGKMDDLILLSVIDNETREERIEQIGFPIVKSFDGIKDFRKLRDLPDSNKEGFVIRFSNGFRVKMKFAEYVRLHRIITQCSNVAIWEHLKDGLPFDELLERVPDEFNNWLKQTEKEFRNKYNAIVETCKNSYQTFPTRKETAEYFKTQPYQSILFAMLDGKSTDRIIWKMIKPIYSKPFKIEI